MKRVDVIQWFIDFLDAKTYLEIGVRDGETFFPIRCKNKIGVDIHFTFPERQDNEKFFEMSSDDYFRYYPSAFDVAFIDGDHTYKQSLRDAENCLRYMRGVILLHDCNPTREELATPEHTGASADWCGEVWKTIVTLRTNPNLFVCVVDEDYGIGVVMKDKNNDTLSYSRNEIERMTYKDLEENRDTFLNLMELPK